MGNSFFVFPLSPKMGNISISLCKETGFSYQMKAIIYVIFIKVARKVEKVIYLWMKRKNALTVCVCVYEREKLRVCERERVKIIIYVIFNKVARKVEKSNLSLGVEKKCTHCPGLCVCV